MLFSEKMEEFEFGFSEKSTTKTTTKPTTEITALTSNELIKIYELNECCNYFESDLKKSYENLETLTSAKIEASRMVSEFKRRNKINAINSESLFQALSELYKYINELKSNFIATEIARKLKNLKYKKIISSYESAWQAALKEYDGDPLSLDLRKIQEENKLLEVEIEKQEKLNESTEMKFEELKENLKEISREKVVDFSRAMLHYKRFLNSTKRKAENDSKNSKGSFRFKLFRAEESLANHPSNSEVSNSYKICGVDISVFEDLIVPSENLESQSLEENSTLGDVSKEEGSLECVNNYHQTMQFNTSVKSQKEDQEQVDGNESHYFRPSETVRQLPSDNQQHSEQWNTSKQQSNKHLESSEENLKSGKTTSGVQQVEQGDDIVKGVQMECEDLIVSDGSYENPANGQRADESSQYHKNSSVSFDDMPPTEEHLSEGSKEQNKTCDENRKSDVEKNNLNSFTGFFLMGNDQDNSKPSIFKLF